MIRIGSIVCAWTICSARRNFWEATLGYMRRDSGEIDDFVLLGPPDGAPEVWSVYGAERSQPVATGGRWDDLESGSDTRKPLPWVATSCPDPKMVRRGSTVRVRQRALQNPRSRGFCFQLDLQDAQLAVGLEPFMEPSGLKRRSDRCLALLICATEWASPTSGTCRRCSRSVRDS